MFMARAYADQSVRYSRQRCMQSELKNSTQRVDRSASKSPVSTITEDDSAVFCKIEGLEAETRK